MTTLELALDNSFYLEQQKELTESLVNDYLMQLDTNSNDTKKTYSKCVKSFVNWVLSKGIRDVSKTTIISYKNELANSCKPRTINTNLIAIKSFYKYLETLGFNNVAKDVKKLKTNNKNHSREMLTLEQVEQLLKSIDTSKLEGARAYAILKLLFGTGLRICELVRADISDLTTRNNCNILLVKGKGQDDKTPVVITASVMQALQHYFLLRGNITSDQPLFVSCSDRNNGKRLTTRTIQNIVKGSYKNIGIVSDKITSHSTRHTAITLAILNGASVQQVQAMARHKDVNTTMIYYHDIDRFNNNAESVLEQLYSNI